ncbi:MAG: thioredoxin family protein [Hyphomicrobiaceae bacterium]
MTKFSLDRRRALLLPAFGAAAWSASRVGATADPALKMTDDGLHHQPWFENTFLDLREDLADATAKGKRLAIFWEQRGCPYCGEMHKVNLGKPEIADYIRDNFFSLQLNLYGSRKVKDFDGKEFEERKLAQRWKVNFTPTVQFFPDDPAAVEGKSGGDAEVWRLLGYWKPFHFLNTFVYVKTKGYDSEPNFQHWLNEYREKLRAEGKDVSLW